VWWCECETVIDLRKDRFLPPLMFGIAPYAQAGFAVGLAMLAPTMVLFFVAICVWGCVSGLYRLRRRAGQ
jgi:hypothetical protein